MISLIIPCYNEAENLEKLHMRILSELSDLKLELIFINDGSKDNTSSVLKKITNSSPYIVKCLEFSRNFGKESAILAGLEYVNKKSKYVAIIDADLQQNPKYIKEMYNILETNDDYDEVAAYQEKRKENRIVVLLKNLFYKLINNCSTTRFESGVSDFRMFRYEVSRAILSLKEHNRFTKGIFSYIGFNIYYLPYKVEERYKGKTNWSIKSLFRYALIGFKNYTNIYLNIIRLLSTLSFISMIIFTIIKLFNKYDKLDFIITLILLVSSIILRVLAMVYDQLKTIDSDTKNRPQYIIRRIINNDK